MDRHSLAWPADAAVLPVQGRGAYLAAGWLAGARSERTEGVAIARVHTDTRTLQVGDLFVALRGERFDANQFIAQAAAQGASAVLCEAAGEAAARAANLPALIVPDARMALGQLAAGWRRGRARCTKPKHTAGEQPIRSVL